MREITAHRITHMISRMITKYNHDVYEERLNSGSNEHPDYKKTPYYIYFYYIAFGASGVPIVKHYSLQAEFPIEHGSVPSFIEHLAKQARDGAEEEGLDFKDIEWRRKSYVAILMDSPYWKLLKRDGGRTSIVFNIDKESAPNHSFFDAKHVEIELEPEQGNEEDDGLRSAIYFVNHMKKSEFGDDLGKTQDGKEREEREHYAFDIYFDVFSKSGASTVFVIDPDGTNVGPPLPPPRRDGVEPKEYAA